MPANAGCSFSCKPHKGVPLTNQTNYAQFNAVTVTGRVFHLEKATNKGSEFLAVTLITTLTTDGTEVLFTFNTSNGLMTLFNNGRLAKGRQLTVTGHIADVKQVWFDNDGAANLLQRPELKLTGAQVLDGGLGPAPKDEVTPARKGMKVNVKPSAAKATAPTDVAPEVDEVHDFV